jgi:phosphoribosylformylglycinamidine cyclo-ligase
MDGVGTKLDLLIRTGRHSVAGQDLVAMCVNDILVQGAEPLFFLDYFATGTLEPTVVEGVVSGVSQACTESGCALLGGETAEMPGFYPGGRYDLAGCAVGIVEREAMIDGSGIRPGDVLLGLVSSGPHSNGFSLIRKVLEKSKASLEEALPGSEGPSLADALLSPTRVYVRPVLELLRETVVAGIAHITGGGIAGNLERIIPEGCCARIRRNAWPVPPVFEFLQKAGAVPREEMVSAFNLGLGLIVVMQEKHAGQAMKRLEQLGVETHAIGRVEEGTSDRDRVVLE